MLGSKYGIAVLEDEVANELNPNVALEYGFMKALSRPVALLRKVGFKHSRADLVGKLAGSFEIEKGKLRVESLEKALGEWLLDQGLHPRDS